MSKNFGQIVPLELKKREEWIQEVREGRTHGTEKSRISALRLVGSSAVSFPGRNDCPGAPCSLMVKEESEVSSYHTFRKD